MKGRVAFLDILRVLCVFCVMLIHVAAENWPLASFPSFDWQVFNFYDSMARFSVPVLVMISGYLLLDPARQTSPSRLFRKNILRMVTCYLFWSSFYALISSGAWKRLNGESAKLFLLYFWEGKFHLWFLPMIVGLYLIVPLLRAITSDRRLTWYFLCLAFFFASVVPAVRLLFPMLSPYMDPLLASANVQFVMGYTLYFVAGHYFGSYDIGKGRRVVIYLLAVASLVFTICMTALLAKNGAAYPQRWYEYLLPNTVMASLGVFLLFKQRHEKRAPSERTQKAFSFFARYSFGMYLVHGVFIGLFGKLNLTTNLCGPLAAVPLLTVLAFAGSFAVSFLLGKIPVLNRYIM